MEWLAGTLIAGTLLAAPIAAQQPVAGWNGYDAYEARAQYVRPGYEARAQYIDPAYEARAQAIAPGYETQARYYVGPRGAYAPGLALEGNKIIGQDPDPFIRTQLRQHRDTSDY